MENSVNQTRPLDTSSKAVLGWKFVTSVFEPKHTLQQASFDNARAGTYRVLLTEAAEQRLVNLEGVLEPIRSVMRALEAADRIALHLARVIERAVDSMAEGEESKALR